MKYSLGVIGGMGTFATTVFFNRLYNKTPAKNDQEYIDTIILNHASMPDRTKCILNGAYSKILDEFKSDFEILNSLKVPLVAIPCNTSHFFFDEFKKMYKGKIINMPYETLKKCEEKGYKKAVVFATRGTLDGRVYEKNAKETKIEIIRPQEEEIDFLMDTIYRVKENKKTDIKTLEDLVKKYLFESTIVILGCTELSTFTLDGTIDAMDVLVEKSIEFVRNENEI